MLNHADTGSSFVRRGGRHLAVGLFGLTAWIVGCSTDVADTPDAGDPSDGERGSTSSALSYPAGSVFATYPTPPGAPEGILVLGSDVYVSGPAKNGTAGLPASQILVYDRATGAPKPPITIVGENTAAEHALSCIAADGNGRIYVLSTQLGVLRFTPSGSGWTQSVYSPPVPDIPSCTFWSPPLCSPTVFNAPPLVNDLAFDAQGNLYITDSYQATIWKVAPGGGAATVWFQSPLFEGVPTQIGLNGIRVSPDNARVYVTVSLPLLSPANGTLYSLPRVAAPAGNQLQIEHLFGLLDGPDGIAFGATGNLFVNLAGTNSIAVLNNNLILEVDRFLGPAGSAIPFDGPANIAFNGDGFMFVTNHAPLSNNAANFATLKVQASDTGAPLFTPSVP